MPPSRGYTGSVPYPPRVEAAGAVFHVTVKGNNDEFVFVGKDDFEAFLVILDRVCQSLGWALLAYCLLGNHVHLIVLTPEPNLAAGMQQLVGQYARSFNGRRGRRGHAFGRRYWSEAVEDELHLYAALAYVGCNPSEAGICDSPRGWQWNSYSAICGHALVPPCLDVDRLLKYFHRERSRALSAYQALVEGRWAELQLRRRRTA